MKRIVPIALLFAACVTQAQVLGGNPVGGTSYVPSHVAITGGTITGLSSPIPVPSGGTGSNLSATGGTSQVLEQTTVGGAVTVAQLAASDLSNGVTGSGVVVLATSPTFVTPKLGAATGTSLSLSGLTANSFLYSGTAGALTTTSAPTNGQLLIGSTGAAPALAALTGTTNQVTVTNGTGSITLATPQNIDTGASTTFASVALTGSANTLTASGSSTTNPVSLTSSGSDANVGITYTSKGTGFHLFHTGGGDQVKIYNTAGSTNTLNLTGSNGGSPNISSSGGGIGMTPMSGTVTVNGTLNATTALQINGAAINAALTGTTGSIGGGALVAGQCTSGTVAVTNSTTSMATAVSPTTYPGDGIWWEGYVSGAGTVTVKVCAAVAMTPTASTYIVRVIQ